MAIQKGDIIYLDYIGYIVDTNEVFDTTIEDEAKKSGVYKANIKYTPIIVAVGEKWVINGLDESLLGRNEGEEYEVEVPPEKGYGERDPKKIRVMSEKRLRELDIKGDVAPGNMILVNGVPAIIRVISGGRVLLDFNPPLAGKKLRYKVYIRKVCTNIREKVEALIKRHSEEFLNKAKIKISEKTGLIEIKLKDHAIKNPSLHAVKKEIAGDIIKLVDTINKVRFVEEVIREEEGEPQRKKEGSLKGRG